MATEDSKVTSNVVGLRDCPITYQRQARSDVIEEAERLLEMAKTGEIIGIGVVYNFYDGTSGFRTRGVSGRSMIGAATEMTYDLVK